MRLDHHDDDDIKKFLVEKKIQLHTKILTGVGRMNGDVAIVKELWRGIVNGKSKDRTGALARAVMDYQGVTQ